MAVGPPGPIKKQVKRLKKNQFIANTIIIVEHIEVRDWRFIMMICSVGGQRTTSRIEDQVQILQALPSVIFQKIGALCPTLSFGHVRVSANLSEHQDTAHRVCSTTMLFKGLTNYTTPGILHNLSPQVATAFSLAEQGKYPSKPFTSFMKAMVNTIESKCHLGEVGIGLVQQIFRSAPIASSTRDTIHDKRQILGAISLLFSAYNFYEIQQLSSEVDTLKQNQCHIITAIKALADATKIVQGNFEKSENETRKIEARVTLRSL